MRLNESGNFENGQSNNGATWDALSNYSPEETSEQLNRERQERKLLAQILMPESMALAEHDVTLSEEARTAALDKIASDEFTQYDADAVLCKIQTPVDKYGPERVFDSCISEDRGLRQVMCLLMAGYDEGSVDRCSAKSLSVLTRQCASPARLEARVEELRDYCEKMKLTSSREKAESWLSVLDAKYEDFKKIIYGKREEYYQVYKGLQQEASWQHNEHPPFDIYEREDGIEMLKNSECEGDIVPTRDGRGHELTTDELLNANLEPKYKVEVDGTEIGLSGTFSIGGGRDAAIGYVKCPDGKIMQRSFYRSNSQGVWRLLPDYVLSFDPKERWYGKGYTEEMMILPSEMQAALCAITERGPVDLDGHDGETIFFGTAKHYNSKKEYFQTMEHSGLRGRVYEEVSHKAAIKLDGRGEISDSKMPPEFLRVAGNPYMRPNYDDEVGNFYTQTRMYGVVGMNCVRSKDKKLTYIFNYANVTYDNGQSEPVVWLGGVETNSPVTSGGIRRDWVAAGDLGTPVLEYVDQDAGYGEKTKTRGPYMSMWRNYVSRIPLIRNFCNYKIRQAKKEQSLSA